MVCLADDSNGSTCVRVTYQVMKDIELLQSYGKPLQRNEMQLAYVPPLLLPFRLSFEVAVKLTLCCVFFLLVLQDDAEETPDAAGLSCAVQGSPERCRGAPAHSGYYAGATCEPAQPRGLAARLPGNVTTCLPLLTFVSQSQPTNTNKPFCVWRHLQFLDKQRQGLEHLTSILNDDLADIKLIKETWRR